MANNSSLKAWLDLCRVSNLPTVWTNVLAAVVLSGAGFSWGAYLLLCLAMSLFYAGGMCLNDLCDAEDDRVRKPARPIPSGRISTGAARRATIAMMAAALFLLGLAPHGEGVYAGLALLLAIASYDILHARWAWTVLLMAGCRLLVFVTTAAAVAGAVSPAVAAAGGAQFAWVLVVTMAARWEKKRVPPLSFPLIPLMIAGISLLDGLLMAALASPLWLAAGAGGMLLTLAGQRLVRGD